MKYSYFFTFALFCLSFSLYAQAPTSEELKARLVSLPESTPPDTILVYQTQLMRALVDENNYEEVQIVFKEIDSFITVQSDKITKESVFKYMQNKTSTLMFTGDFKSAASILKEIELLAHTPKEKLSFYGLQGLFYLQSDEIDSALYFLKRAIAVYPGKIPEESVLFVANSYLNIGSVFNSKELIDSAVYYSQKAMTIFAQYGYSEGELQAELLLGKLLAKAERYIAASEHFKSVYDKTKDKHYSDFSHGLKYDALLSWFKSEYLRGEQNDSLKQLVVQAFPETNTPFLMRNRFDFALALSEYETEYGDMKQALVFINEAMRIGEQVIDKFSFTNVLINKGLILIELGRLTEAPEILNRALHLAEQSSQIRDRKNVYLLLNRLYTEVGDKKNALYYVNKYTDLSDSIRGYQISEKLAEQEVRFNTEKKEQENLLLKEQNKTKEAELKATNSQNIILLISVAALAVFAVLIFQSQRRQRRANNMLQESKEEIRSQAEELRSSNEILRELDQFKQRMMSMIMHDFKNPLAVVINDTDQPKIRNAGMRLMSMTQTFLDVQRFRDANISVIKAQVLTDELLDRTQRNFEYQLSAKNLRLEILNEVSVETEIAPDLTLRILENLLNNAVKFTPPGGAIRISATLKEQGLYLKTEDSGPGISEDQYELVFTDFYQSAEGKSHKGSSGLGLAFCKLASEAQSGSISVSRSEELGGACFTVCLPNVISSSSEASVTSSEIDYNEDVSDVFTFSEKDLRTRTLLYEAVSDMELFMYTEVTEKAEALIEPEQLELIRWRSEIKKAMTFGDEKRFRDLISRLKA